MPRSGFELGTVLVRVRLGILLGSGLNFRKPPNYTTTLLHPFTLLPYYRTTLLPYYPTTGYVGWVRGPLALSVTYVLMQLWIPHDTFDWIFGATNTSWTSSIDAGVVTCDLISNSFKVTDGVSAFSFSRSTKSLRRGVSFSLPPRSFKSCLIIVFIEASSTDRRSTVAFSVPTSSTSNWLFDRLLCRFLALSISMMLTRFSKGPRASVTSGRKSDEEVVLAASNYM